MILRYQPVRASTHLSVTFTLDMVSSSGFGSYPNCISISQHLNLKQARGLNVEFENALLTLGFPTHTSHKDLYLAIWINSLGHSSIGTPSPDYLAIGRLRLFVGIWFQFYFTPLTGVLFTFPSRYLFTIGH